MYKRSPIKKREPSLHASKCIQLLQEEHSLLQEFVFPLHEVKIWACKECMKRVKHVHERKYMKEVKINACKVKACEEKETWAAWQ